jgi:hypothetical protein
LNNYQIIKIGHILSGGRNLTFIINGIVRSLTLEEMVFMLKNILIGKKIKFNEQQTSIQDIYMEGTYMFISYSHSSLVVKSVNEIEIDQHNNVVKVSGKEERLIFKI